MNSSADGILQNTAIISKTTQTLIGAEIDCRGYKFITLYFTYTKGDESGLKIIPSFMRTSGGTEYKFGEWYGSSSGRKSFIPSYFEMTATTNGYITLNIEGIDYVKFTQGGLSNDGTPTGTLSASYVIKG